MKLRDAAAALCTAVAMLRADAHALLERADPRVGSIVQVAPTEVKLWFSEPLEPAFSGAEVRDSSGRRVDAALIRVDEQDRRLLYIALAPLVPGDYTVTWRVVSIDTHVTNGDFHFRVGQ